MVCILISTYNGQKFLVEQLDSLIKQDYKNIKIIIRDDGSKDETVNILLAYKNKYSNIELVTGSNVGVVASFFELLKHVPPEAGYTAFCDQDDVWDPGKVSRAVSQLSQSNNEIPSLYCSRLKVVDASLNFLFDTALPKRELNFENAIIENFAIGCTIMFNRVARELLVNNLPDDKKVVMHDWWCYLVIAALGTVIYDKEAYIKHRQHDTNTNGMKKSIKHLLRKLKRAASGGYRLKFHNQLMEFKRIFAPRLPTNQLTLLDEFLENLNNREIFKRISYVMRGRFYNQVFMRDIVFKMLFIMGKL